MLTSSMQSADVPRRGPSDRQSVLACLAQFKRSRGREFDLQMPGVFGSVARGEARQDSDIDVVFRIPPLCAGGWRTFFWCWSASPGALWVSDQVALLQMR